MLRGKHEQKIEKRKLHKEKEAFKVLLRKHSAVLETRKSDFVTNKAKSDSWQRIQVSMNAQFPGKEPRTIPQLKKLWERMKLDAKQELDAYSLKGSLFLRHSNPPILLHHALSSDSACFVSNGTL